jgi:hypothetical protein
MVDRNVHLTRPVGPDLRTAASLVFKHFSRFLVALDAFIDRLLIAAQHTIFDNLTFFYGQARR